MANDKAAIRARFIASLQAGKTTEEATKIANGVSTPSRAAAELDPPTPAVKKGSDGKWYVMVAGKKKAGPFDTKKAAQAEIDGGKK